MEAASDSVTTAMLKDSSVTDAKIASVASSKISGTIDWSKLANIPATFAAAAHTHNYSDLGNQAGSYINYKPNNTACGDQQTLIWDNSNSRWVCGSSLGSAANLTAGTSANNVVQLDANSKLPAIDASQVINYPYPRSYLTGFKMANNTTSPNTDIDIAIGAARSDDDSFNIKLSSAITKQLSTNWTAGTGQGMLDTGVVAINTWYHIFAIFNSTTSAVDILASTSVSAPTLPAGYTQKRRIGSVRTNASGNILAFTQYGDEFRLSAGIYDYSGAGTRALSLLTLTVPTGVQVRPIIYVSVIASANGNHTIYVAPGDNIGSLGALTYAVYNLEGGQAMSYGPYTNTSAQIYLQVYSTATVSSAFARTLGWIDSRGRDD